MSTQDEDFDAFKAVTPYPFLSKCVRMVVYDAVAIGATYSLSHYVNRLDGTGPVQPPRLFGNPDPEANLMVYLLRTGPNHRRNLQDYVTNEDTGIARRHAFHIREICRLGTTRETGDQH